MKTVRVVKFDPMPRLHATKPIEQALALLLALYQLGRVESAAVAAGYVQACHFWRGLPPDWEATWQDRCVKRQYVALKDGCYSLTAHGIARLHDLCTLAFAMREPFYHLTSPGYQTVCRTRKEIKGRPFTNRAVSKARPQLKGGQFHVYVILLRTDAVNTHPNLRDINPERRANHPCLYVGYTSMTPEIRFKAHKDGNQASQIVMDYGICLVPDLYADLNPINGREQAIETERRYAAGIRKHGYTVTAGHHDWE